MVCPPTVAGQPAGYANAAARSVESTASFLCSGACSLDASLQQRGFLQITVSQIIRCKTNSGEAEAGTATANPNKIGSKLWEIISAPVSAFAILPELYFNLDCFFFLPRDASSWVIAAWQGALHKINTVLQFMRKHDCRGCFGQPAALDRSFWRTIWIVPNHPAGTTTIPGVSDVYLPAQSFARWLCQSQWCVEIA